MLNLNDLLLQSITRELANEVPCKFYFYLLELLTIFP